MGIISKLFIFILAQTSPLPAGTPLNARLESQVQTASSAVGDRVSAVVTSRVAKGAHLNGRVETIEPATRDRVGHVRLVFREIQFPGGRLTPTWITNSFDASPPNRNRRYAVLMGVGAAAGGLIGGKTARFAGILGGALIGFIVGGTSDGSKLPDLVLKPGQTLHLQLGEDLVIN